MLKAMRTAASGMAGQQMNVDNIANNLANVSTTGYKKTRLQFQDILYQHLRRPGAASSATTELPTGLAVGYGTKPAATVRQFSTGDLLRTDAPLDIAIEGDGFFQVQLPDGTLAYTRDGSFHMSRDGRVVNSEGFFIEPQLTVPEDAMAITIGNDGVVQVEQYGTVEPTEIGRVELARFFNPAGLASIGKNLAVETGASGTPTTQNPGENGVGFVSQGYLEMSNVEVVDEMVDMIVAQRAYEMNSKAIQTSDEMSAIANNLKR